MKKIFFMYITIIITSNFAHLPDITNPSTSSAAPTSISATPISIFLATLAANNTISTAAQNFQNFQEYSPNSVSLASPSEYNLWFAANIITNFF